MWKLSPGSIAWAGVGVEVIGVGIGTYMTPMVGIIIALLGLVFFYPAMKEWFTTPRGNAPEFSGVIVAILIATLVIIAGVWVYRFFQDREPLTSVRVVDIVSAHENTLFEPKRKTKFGLVVENIGPFLAHDATWDAELFIHPAPVLPSTEDEIFNTFRKKPHTLTRMDLGVGQQYVTTEETHELTQEDVDGLQARKQVLYLVGFVQYRDENGLHEFELCKFLIPPKTVPYEALTWALCHDGTHNSFLKQRLF